MKITDSCRAAIASFASSPAGARVKRLAPFFLIGPISGPLLAGVVFNFRGGRPVLGTLYAIALALFILELPLATAKALTPHGHP